MKTLFSKVTGLAALLASGTTLNLPAQPAVPVPAVASKPAVTSGAHIAFETPVYDFGKISGGSVAKHDYIFTNTGNAMLELSDVRPSCGCTTAATWSRQVEPGKTGTIPIQFNSGSYSGAIQKTVTVTCNDSNQPVIMLQLKGTIWKPIDVTPTYAIFNPMADAQTNETRVVRIVNNTDEAITLSSPESANKSFSAEIKTITPGKEFELRISAAPPFASTSIQGPVTVKTSSTNMPVITVNAIAMVQQAIQVMPTQVTLPGGALAPNTKSGVTIRNNSSSTITLKEPTLSLISSHFVGGTNSTTTEPMKGVDAQVQELQAGRVFNVMLSFPTGFEIQPGQRGELSLKTSHPQNPVIKIPIYQIARPLQTLPPVVPPAPAALQPRANPVRLSPAVPPMPPAKPASAK